MNKKRVLDEHKKNKKNLVYPPTTLATHRGPLDNEPRQLSRWANGSCDYLNLEQSIL